MSALTALGPKVAVWASFQPFPTKFTLWPTRTFDAAGKNASKL